MALIGQSVLRFVQVPHRGVAEPCSELRFLVHDTHRARTALFWCLSGYLLFLSSMIQRICEFCRLVQVSSLSDDSSTKRNSESIRALRAIRVLRPLKLVSGIPSKHSKRFMQSALH